MNEKLAIVHDFLNQHGGAENVVATLHEVFPEAPVYTSFCLLNNLPKEFSSLDVRSSFMQKLPLLQNHFKKYLLLYPAAIESLDLSGFDVILSSSSAFAKGARKALGALHICYCYTPMRFVWNSESYLKKENLNFVFKMMLPLALSFLRRWDIRTSFRVDYFIAISKYIQKRIKDIYGRDSEVIYPPVNTKKFKVSDSIDDYYLIVSRLNPYKNIDLVIKHFNQTSIRLLIVGTGPYANALKKMANRNIEFLGKVEESELTRLLSRCRGFIFPGEEDFGIAPVEAMASGRPVIAYGRGGALETVIPGKTGFFFQELTPESLDAAIRQSEKTVWMPQEIRKHAQQFDEEIFKAKIKSFIQATVERNKIRAVA